MKTIHTLSIIILCLFFYSQTKAQSDDIIITINDISKANIIDGSCNSVPDAVLYEYTYNSPGFPTTRLFSPTPSFSFTTNNSDEHIISLRVHTRVDGVLIYRTLRTLYVTEVLEFDQILNFLDCENLAPDAVLRPNDIPFEIPDGNPDYSACAVCTYLNLALLSSKQFTDEKDYVIYYSEVIAKACHFDYEAYIIEENNYDFCNETAIIEAMVVYSSGRLSNPNITNIEKTDILPEGSELKLYNSQGAIVYTTQLQSNINLKDIGLLNNVFNQHGIYILHVTKNGELLKNEKIIF